ncbi:MAG: radical SAM protein [Clostridia bacterium]|nr:radical SAM protein [Clostridia bacterium]
MKCFICPRNCNINRDTNLGFCSSPSTIYIAKYMLHKWEEPLISGNQENKGSGAIFFSGCNLKCVYCQNYEISSKCVGKKVSVEELTKIFKDLEKMGALNINLVSPTHYTNQIIKALKIYTPKIPVIWNSNGYEKEETIKQLKDYIDVYLVDFKYSNNELSTKLSKANNYVENCQKTILQMKENQPNDIIENGIIKKGVIIRHLVLPNYIENSFEVLDWIKTNLGTNQIISIMSQYTPCYLAKDFPEINRNLKPIEYKRVINHFLKLGFANGFCQELSSASSSFTPDFSKFRE